MINTEKGLTFLYLTGRFLMKGYRSSQIYSRRRLDVVGSSIEKII